jgi:hypothetical protein
LPSKSIDLIEQIKLENMAIQHFAIIVGHKINANINLILCERVYNIRTASLKGNFPLHSFYDHEDFE